MDLITLILGIALVGVALWLINAYVPMEATIKRILNVVVILVLILWILSAFGVLGFLRQPVRIVPNN